MSIPAKKLTEPAAVSMEFLDNFKEFSEILAKALTSGERVVLTRQGKPIGAIVPWEDVKILQTLEDIVDADAALEALKEPGVLSLADVKRELGLER